MPGSNDSYDPGETSHRALHGIRQELERHPLVRAAHGFPEGNYTKVVADITTPRIAAETESATLTVHWFAGESTSARPEFSFHYSDDGSDLGWHHHPQDHVDGWGHFQERTESEPQYTYEPYTFSSHNPVRVVWEVMAQLTDHLESD